ncbi:hypothetical protein BASA81_008656 [Batrachochytrium salamandrivorans]|nr:hypothetical protein BASA81_008656 [Batrachochytrium salamandrivorans]
MFGPRRSDWEQLYDFKTQSYFYRHKLSGEFSRTHDFLKPGDTTPISQLPIWVFKIDRASENRDTYWEDLETGQVSFLRPALGTFVDEQHLSDFRRFNSSSSFSSGAKRHHHASSNSRSTTSFRQGGDYVETHLLDTHNLKPIRPNQDFALVGGLQQDVNLQELFSEANPDNFDPSTRMEAAAAAINGQAPPPTVRQIRMRRMETRDGGETPDFPVLDEHVIEKKSVQYSDNPLFNPTPPSEPKRASRWG